jgi:hypothetical protein
MEKIAYLIEKICILHQVNAILGSRRIRCQRKAGIMSHLYLKNLKGGTTFVI